MNRYIIHFLSVLLLSLFLSGCKEKYSPKPNGFFRIDLPEKEYLIFTNSFPYSFEYPVYSTIVPDTTGKVEPYWIDISIPGNNAMVHLSYKRVDGNLTQLTEDSRELAYKHAIKATSIDEKVFINTENKVFGTVYNIKGNAASPMQFYVTDSSHHFLRGAFYISEVPNYDSLLPVITFLETDIIHLIETLHWK